MLEHILCEFLVLEKIRVQTLGFAKMEPDQIKEVRLSSIVAFGKGAGLLIAPYKFKWKGKENGPEAWVLESQSEATSQKKIKIKTKTGWH